MSSKREIVYHDGSRGELGDFPIAVTYMQKTTTPDGEPMEDTLVVDPIFNSQVSKNLYGRIMTLVEATTDPAKLKPVKDLFSRELLNWESDVHQGARQITEKATDPYNIYFR